MRLKRIGGEWIWVDFKYECLNIFCFICGLLGHTERICPSLYENEGGNVIKPYSSWMKAPTRRGVMSSGERWLKTAPPELDEGKIGIPSKSETTMIVDEHVGTKSGDDGSKSRRKEVMVWNLPLTKEIVIPPTSCRKMCLNGKDAGDYANVMVLLKENAEDYDSELIISDAKKIRSQVGPQTPMGLEDSTTTQLMEITGDTKKTSSGT